MGLQEIFDYIVFWIIFVGLSLIYSFYVCLRFFLRRSLARGLTYEHETDARSSELTLPKVNFFFPASCFNY